MNKFRPQDVLKSRTIKERLKFGRCENYNWQSRVKWHPVGWRLNKKTIGYQFGRLHYLARHAPESVQMRWCSVYDTFYKKHFGTQYASVRYLNNYSCHSWL